MKVIIVHGIEGHKDENWFPWLRRELEKKGIFVWCETLLTPNAPIADEWVRTVLDHTKPDDILIGHSLGGPTILRVAEQIHDGKLRALISVAGFQSLPNYPAEQSIAPFLRGGFDWQKIKNSVEKIFILDSDNDPYVPLSEGKILQARLGGKHQTFHGRGHLNRWGATQKSGEQTFPEILDLVVQLK